MHCVPVLCELAGRNVVALVTDCCPEYVLNHFQI